MNYIIIIIIISIKHVFLTFYINRVTLYQYLFNTEVIVDSFISRAWKPHALLLSDRKNLLWQCRRNQSEVIPGVGIPEQAV